MHGCSQPPAQLLQACAVFGIIKLNLTGVLYFQLDNGERITLRSGDIIGHRIR